MMNKLTGHFDLVDTRYEVGQIDLVSDCDSQRVKTGFSLGGKRGVLELMTTSAEVGVGGEQARVLGRFLRNESAQSVANNVSSSELKFATYPYWRQVTSRFVEHLTISSTVLHAVVHPSFSTAHYAHSVFLAVCQVLRDISCVNPSRTPKAFKGKGSAVNQGVTSGLNASHSGLVGAGA